LFDDGVDVPTNPRTIDPGGTPLPAARVSAVRARVIEAMTIAENSPREIERRAEIAAYDQHRQERAGAGVAPTPWDEWRAAQQPEPATAHTAGDADPDLAPAAVGEATPRDGGTDYRPGRAIHVPSGAKARARANIAAITLVQALDGEDRPATADEQEVLAAWSGWGAVPQIFDDREEWASENAELRGLLSQQEYRRASANTLNAHYTDPKVAGALWDAVGDAGFSGGRVLEPGSGSGTFIGLAPADAGMVGVEIDPITARISAYLYPSAQIRNEGFERTRVPENSFVATIGNVPFLGVALHDPSHNAAGHSVHNHFILKSLALTAPGGYVATISSHFTLDSARRGARQDMADVADLVGAVRLPTRAFRAVAGTDVVTDIIILRKREEGREPATGQNWVDTAAAGARDKDGGYTETDINDYFLDHPENVLGELHVGHGMYNAETLEVRNTSGGPLVEQVRDRLAVIAGPMARQSTPLGTLTYNKDDGVLQRWNGVEPRQYTSLAFTDRLVEAGIDASVGTTGDCLLTG
jgi:hypothetical protein